jgi:hypothetical protein
MKCFQALEDMSLALDGRLDSAERKLLAEHLRGCGCCRHDYRSLRQAMSLASEVRTHSVSPGFREDLFRRIEAGEGTPIGAIREYVPFAAKVRFTLLGAAAAALVLLAAGYFLPGGPIWRARQVDVVMKGQPVGTEPTAGMLVQGGLRPMTELVGNAVHETRLAVDDLRQAAYRLQGQPPERAIPELRVFAVQARERAHFVRALAHPWAAKDAMQELDEWTRYLTGVSELPLETPVALFRQRLEPVMREPFSLWIEIKDGKASVVRQPDPPRR